MANNPTNETVISVTLSLKVDKPSIDEAKRTIDDVKRYANVSTNISSVSSAPSTSFNNQVNTVAGNQGSYGVASHVDRTAATISSAFEKTGQTLEDISKTAENTATKIKTSVAQAGTALDNLNKSAETVKTTVSEFNNLLNTYGKVPSTSYVRSLSVTEGPAGNPAAPAAGISSADLRQQINAQKETNEILKRIANDLSLQIQNNRFVTSSNNNQNGQQPAVPLSITRSATTLQNLQTVSGKIEGIDTLTDNIAILNKNIDALKSRTNLAPTNTENAVAKSLEKLSQTITDAYNKGRVTGTGGEEIEVVTSRYAKKLKDSYKLLGDTVDEVAKGTGTLGKAKVFETFDTRKDVNGNTVTSLSGLDFKLLDVKKLQQIAEQQLKTQVAGLDFTNDAVIKGVLADLQKKLGDKFNKAVDDAVISFKLPAVAASNEGIKTVFSGAKGTVEARNIDFIEFKSGIDRIAEAISKSEGIKKPVGLEAGQNTIRTEIAEGKLLRGIDDLKSSIPLIVNGGVKVDEIRNAVIAAIAAEAGKQKAAEEVRNSILRNSVGSESERQALATRVSRMGVSSNDLTQEQLQSVREFSSNLRQALADSNKKIPELLENAKKFNVATQSIFDQLSQYNQSNVYDKIRENLIKAQAGGTGDFNRTALGQTYVNLVGFRDNAPDVNRAKSAFSKQVTESTASMEPLNTQVRAQRDREGNVVGYVKGNTSANLLQQVQVTAPIPVVATTGENINDLSFYRRRSEAIKALQEDLRRTSESFLFSGRTDVDHALNLSSKAVSETIAADLREKNAQGREVNKGTVGTFTVARGDTRAMIPFARTATSTRRSDQPLSGIGDSFPTLRTREYQEAIDTGVAQPTVFNVTREFRKSSSTFEDQILINANSALAKQLTGVVKNMVVQAGARFLDKAGNLIDPTKDKEFQQLVVGQGKAITDILGIPGNALEDKVSQAKLVELVKTTIRQGPAETDANVLKILQEYSSQGGRKVILPGGTKGTLRFVTGESPLGKQIAPTTPYERLQKLKGPPSAADNALYTKANIAGNLMFLTPGELDSLGIELPKQSLASVGIDTTGKSVAERQEITRKLLEDTRNQYAAKLGIDAPSNYNETTRAAFLKQYAQKTKSVATKERDIDLRISGQDVARRGLRTDILEGLANQTFGEIPVVLGRESPEALRKVTEAIGEDIGFYKSKTGTPVLTRTVGGLERNNSSDLSLVNTGPVSELPIQRPQSGVRPLQELKLDPNTLAALRTTFSPVGGKESEFITDISKIGQKSEGSVRVLELIQTLAVLDKELVKANPQLKSFVDDISSVGPSISPSNIKPFGQSFGRPEDLRGTIFDRDLSHASAFNIQIPEAIRNALPSGELPSSVYVPSTLSRGTFNPGTGLIGIDQIGAQLDRVIGSIKEAEVRKVDPYEALKSGLDELFSGTHDLLSEGKIKPEDVIKEVDNIITELTKPLDESGKTVLVPSEVTSLLKAKGNINDSADKTKAAKLAIEELKRVFLRGDGTTASVLDTYSTSPGGEKAFGLISDAFSKTASNLGNVSGDAYVKGINFKPGDTVSLDSAREVKRAVAGLTGAIKDQIFGKEGILDQEMADLKIPNLRLVASNAPLNVREDLKKTLSAYKDADVKGAFGSLVKGPDNKDSIDALNKFKETAGELNAKSAAVITVHTDRLKELLEQLAKAGNISESKIPELLNRAQKGELYGVTGRFPVTSYKSLQPRQIQITDDPNQQFTATIAGSISDQDKAALKKLKDSIFKEAKIEDDKVVTPASGALVDLRNQRSQILELAPKDQALFKDDLATLNKKIQLLEDSLASLSGVFHSVTQELDFDGDKLQIFLSGTTGAAGELTNAQKELAEKTKLLLNPGSDYGSLLQQKTATAGGSKLRKKFGEHLTPKGDDGIPEDVFSQLELDFQKQQHPGFLAAELLDSGILPNSDRLRSRVADSLAHGVYSDLRGPKAVANISDAFKEVLAGNIVSTTKDEQGNVISSTSNEEVLFSFLKKLGITPSINKIQEGGLDTEATQANLDKLAKEALEKYDIKNTVTKLADPKLLVAPVTEAIVTPARLMEAKAKQLLAQNPNDAALQKEIEDKVKAVQSFGAAIIQEALSTKFGTVPKALPLLEAFDAPLNLEKKGKTNLNKYIATYGNEELFSSKQIEEARRESLSRLSREELEDRAKAFIKLNPKAIFGKKSAEGVDAGALIGETSSKDIIDTLSKDFSFSSIIKSIRGTLEESSKQALGARFSDQEKRLAAGGTSPELSRTATLEDIAKLFDVAAKRNSGKTSVQEISKVTGISTDKLNDLSTPIEEIVSKLVETQGPRLFEAATVSPFRKIRTKDRSNLEYTFGTLTEDEKDKEYQTFLRRGGVTTALLKSLKDSATSDLPTSENEAVKRFFDSSTQVFSSSINEINDLVREYSNSLGVSGSPLKEYRLSTPVEGREGVFEFSKYGELNKEFFNTRRNFDSKIDAIYERLGVPTIGPESLAVDLLGKRKGLSEKIAGSDLDFSKKELFEQVLSMPLEDFLSIKRDVIEKLKEKAPEYSKDLEDIYTDILNNPLRGFAKSSRRIRGVENLASGKEGDLELQQLFLDEDALDPGERLLYSSSKKVKSGGKLFTNLKSDYEKVLNVENLLREKKLEELKSITPTLESSSDFIEKLRTTDFTPSAAIPNAPTTASIGGGTGTGTGGGGGGIGGGPGDIYGGGGPGGGVFSNQLITAIVQLISVLQENQVVMQKLLVSMVEGSISGGGDVLRGSASDFQRKAREYATENIAASPVLLQRLEQYAPAISSQENLRQAIAGLNTSSKLVFSASTATRVNEKGGSIYDITEYIGRHNPEFGRPFDSLRENQDTKYTRLGTAVDEAITEYQRVKLTTKNHSAAVEASTKKLEEQIESAGFKGNTSFERSARDLLGSFLTNPSKTSRNVLAPQAKFNTSLDGVPLAGTIDSLVDLSEQSGKPTLGILDFKSGKVPGVSDVVNHLQLRIYAAAIDSLRRDSTSLDGFVKSAIPDAPEGSGEQIKQEIQHRREKLRKLLEKEDLQIVAGIDPIDMPVRSFQVSDVDINTTRTKVRELYDTAELNRDKLTTQLKSGDFNNLSRVLEDRAKSSKALQAAQGDKGTFDNKVLNDLGRIDFGRLPPNKEFIRSINDSIEGLANSQADIPKLKEEAEKALAEKFVKNPKFSNLGPNVLGEFVNGNTYLNESKFSNLKELADRNSLTVADITGNKEAIAGLVHESAHLGLKDAFEDTSFIKQLFDLIDSGAKTKIPDIIKKSADITIDSTADNQFVRSSFGDKAIPDNIDAILKQSVGARLKLNSAPVLSDDIKEPVEKITNELIKQSLNELLAERFTQRVLGDKASGINLGRVTGAGSDEQKILDSLLRGALTDKDVKSKIRSFSVEDPRSEMEKLREQMGYPDPETEAGGASKLERDRQLMTMAESRIPGSEAIAGVDDLFQKVVNDKDLIRLPNNYSSTSEVGSFIKAIETAQDAASSRVTERSGTLIDTASRGPYSKSLYNALSGGVEVTDKSLEAELAGRAKTITDVVRELQYGKISSGEAQERIQPIFKTLASTVGTKDLQQLNTEVNLAVTQGIVENIKRLTERFKNKEIDATEFEQTFKNLYRSFAEAVARPILAKKSTSPFIVNPYSSTREIIPQAAALEGIGDVIPRRALEGSLREVSPAVKEALRVAVGDIESSSGDRLRKIYDILLQSPQLSKDTTNLRSALGQVSISGNLFEGNEPARKEFQRIINSVASLESAFDRATFSTIKLTDADIKQVEASLAKAKINEKDLGKLIYNDDTRKVNLKEVFRELGPVVAVPGNVPVPVQQQLVNKNLEELRKRFLIPDEVLRRHGVAAGPGNEDYTYSYRFKDEGSGGIGVAKAGVIQREFRRPEGKDVGFKEIVNDVDASYNNRRTLIDAFRRVAFYGTASGAVYGLVTTFSKLADTIKEAEINMIELQKVMNPATTDFDELKSKAVDFAREFGTSVNSVLKSFVIFAKQGLSQREVLDRGRVSTLAANVTDINPTQATEAITSSLKQFPELGTDAIRVLDSFNDVADKFAVTEKDLAQAVYRAGAAAKVSGVSFDELIGIVTTLGEVTRATGNEVGNSLKVLFRSVYKPDSVKALSEIGISTTSVNGIKSVTEIFKELAEKYDSLNSQQRLNTLQAIAGSRRYNDLAVIISNFNTALKATDVSLNSQGSSMRENELVMDSFAKRMQVIGAEVENIAIQFGDLALKGIKPILSVVTELLHFVGDIPTGIKATAVALGGLFVILDKMSTISSTVSRIFTGFPTITGFFKSLIGGSQIALSALPEKAQFAGRTLPFQNFKSVAVGAGLLYSDVGKDLINYASGGFDKLQQTLGFKGFGDAIASDYRKRLALEREEVSNLSDIESKYRQIGSSYAKAANISSLSRSATIERIQEGTFESPVLIRKNALKEERELVNSLATSHIELVDYYDKEGNAILKQNNLLGVQVGIFKDIGNQALAISKLDIASGFAKQLYGVGDSLREAVKDALSVVDKFIPGLGSFFGDKIQLSPVKQLEKSSLGLNDLIKKKDAGDFTVDGDIRARQIEIEKAKQAYDELNSKFSSYVLGGIKGLAPGDIASRLSFGDLGKGLSEVSRLDLGKSGALVGLSPLDRTALIDQNRLQTIAGYAFNQFGVPRGVNSGKEIAAKLQELGITPKEAESGASAAEVNIGDIVTFSRDIADKLQLSAEFAVKTVDGLLSLDKDGNIKTVLTRDINSAYDTVGDKFVSVFSKVADTTKQLFENAVKEVLKTPVGAGFGISFKGGINLGASSEEEIDPQARIYKLLESVPVSLGSTKASKNFLDIVASQQSKYNKAIADLNLDKPTEDIEDLAKVSDEAKQHVSELASVLGRNAAFITFTEKLQKLGDSLNSFADDVEKAAYSLTLRRQYSDINLLTGLPNRQTPPIGDTLARQTPFARFSATNSGFGRILDRFEEANVAQDNSVKFLETIKAASLDFEKTAEDFANAGIFDLKDVGDIFKTTLKDGPVVGSLDKLTNINEKQVSISQEINQGIRGLNEKFAKQFNLAGDIPDNQKVPLTKLQTAIDRFDIPAIKSALLEVSKNNGSFAKDLQEKSITALKEKLRELTVPGGLALQGVRNYADSRKSQANDELQKLLDLGLSREDAVKSLSKSNPDLASVIKVNDKFSEIDKIKEGVKSGEGLRNNLGVGLGIYSALLAATAEGNSINRRKDFSSDLIDLYNKNRRQVITNLVNDFKTNAPIELPNTNKIRDTASLSGRVDRQLIAAAKATSIDESGGLLGVIPAFFKNFGEIRAGAGIAKDLTKVFDKGNISDALLNTLEKLNTQGPGYLLEKTQVDLLRGILYELVKQTNDTQLLSALQQKPGELATTIKENEFNLKNQPVLSGLASVLGQVANIGITGLTVNRLSQTDLSFESIRGLLNSVGLNLPNKEKGIDQVKQLQAEILQSDVFKNSVSPNIQKKLVDSVNELRDLTDQFEKTPDEDKLAVNINAVKDRISAIIAEMQAQAENNADSILASREKFSQIIAFARGIFDDLATVMESGFKDLRNNIISQISEFSKPSLGAGELAGFKSISPSTDLRIFKSELSPEESFFNKRRGDVESLNLLTSSFENVNQTITSLSEKLIELREEGAPTKVVDILKDRITALDDFSQSMADSIRKLTKSLGEGLQVERVIHQIDALNEKFNILDKNDIFYKDFDRTLLDRVGEIQTPQILESRGGRQYLGTAGLTGFEQEVEKSGAGRLDRKSRQELELRTEQEDIRRRQAVEVNKVQKEVEYAQNIRGVVQDALEKKTPGADKALRLINNALSSAGEVEGKESNVVRFRGVDLSSLMKSVKNVFGGNLDLSKENENAQAIAEALAEKLSEINDKTNDVMTSGFNELIKSNTSLLGTLINVGVQSLDVLRSIAGMPKSNIASVYTAGMGGGSGGGVAGGGSIGGGIGGYAGSGSVGVFPGGYIGGSGYIGQNGFSGPGFSGGSGNYFGGPSFQRLATLGSLSKGFFGVNFNPTTDIPYPSAPIPQSSTNNVDYGRLIGAGFDSYPPILEIGHTTGASKWLEVLASKPGYAAAAALAKGIPAYLAMRKANPRNVIDAAKNVKDTANNIPGSSDVTDRLPDEADPNIASYSVIDGKKDDSFIGNHPIMASLIAAKVAPLILLGIHNRDAIRDKLLETGNPLGGLFKGLSTNIETPFTRLYSSLNKARPSLLPEEYISHITNSGIRSSYGAPSLGGSIDTTERALSIKQIRDLIQGKNPEQVLANTASLFSRTERPGSSRRSSFLLPDDGGSAGLIRERDGKIILNSDEFVSLRRIEDTRGIRPFDLLSHRGVRNTNAASVFAHEIGHRATVPQFYTTSLTSDKVASILEGGVGRDNKYIIDAINHVTAKLGEGTELRNIFSELVADRFRQRLSPKASTPYYPSSIRKATSIEKSTDEYKRFFSVLDNLLAELVRDEHLPPEVINELARIEEVSTRLGSKTRYTFPVLELLNEKVLNIADKLKGTTTGKFFDYAAKSISEVHSVLKGLVGPLDAGAINAVQASLEFGPKAEGVAGVVGNIDGAVEGAFNARELAGISRPSILESTSGFAKRGYKYGKKALGAANKYVLTPLAVGIAAKDAYDAYNETGGSYAAAIESGLLFKRLRYADADTRLGKVATGAANIAGAGFIPGLIGGAIGSLAGPGGTVAGASIGGYIGTALGAGREVVEGATGEQNYVSNKLTELFQPQLAAKQRIFRNANQSSLYRDRHDKYKELAQYYLNPPTINSASILVGSDSPFDASPSVPTDNEERKKATILLEKIKQDEIENIKKTIPGIQSSNNYTLEQVRSSVYGNYIEKGKTLDIGAVSNYVDKKPTIPYSRFLSDESMGIAKKVLAKKIDENIQEVVEKYRNQPEELNKHLKDVLSRSLQQASEKISDDSNKFFDVFGDGTYSVEEVGDKYVNSPTDDWSTRTINKVRNYISKIPGKEYLSKLGGKLGIGNNISKQEAFSALSNEISTLGIDKDLNSSIGKITVNELTKRPFSIGNIAESISHPVNSFSKLFSISEGERIAREALFKESVNAPSIGSSFDLEKVSKKPLDNARDSLTAAVDAYGKLSDKFQQNRAYLTNEDIAKIEALGKYTKEFWKKTAEKGDIALTPALNQAAADFKSAANIDKGLNSRLDVGRTNYADFNKLAPSYYSLDTMFKGVEDNQYNEQGKKAKTQYTEGLKENLKAFGIDDESIVGARGKVDSLRFSIEDLRKAMQDAGQESAFMKMIENLRNGTAGNSPIETFLREAGSRQTIPVEYGPLGPNGEKQTYTQGSYLGTQQDSVFLRKAAGLYNITSFPLEGENDYSTLVPDGATEKSQNADNNKAAIQQIFANADKQRDFRKDFITNKFITENPDSPLALPGFFKKLGIKVRDYNKPDFGKTNSKGSYNYFGIDNQPVDYTTEVDKDYSKSIDRNPMLNRLLGSYGKEGIVTRGDLLFDSSSGNSDINNFIGNDKAGKVLGVFAAGSTRTDDANSSRLKFLDKMGILKKLGLDLNQNGGETRAVYSGTNDEFKGNLKDVVSQELETPGKGKNKILLDRIFGNPEEGSKEKEEKEKNKDMEAGVLKVSSILVADGKGELKVGTLKAENIEGKLNIAGAGGAVGAAPVGSDLAKAIESAVNSAMSDVQSTINKAKQVIDASNSALSSNIDLTNKYNELAQKDVELDTKIASKADVAALAAVDSKVTSLLDKHQGT